MPLFDRLQNKQVTTLWQYYYEVNLFVQVVQSIGIDDFLLLFLANFKN